VATRQLHKWAPLAAFCMCLPGCDDDIPLARSTPDISESSDTDDGTDTSSSSSVTQKSDDFDIDEERTNAVPKEVEEAKKQLVGDLRKRSANLEDKKIALAQRSAELVSLQDELNHRLHNITELEARLQAQLGIGKAARARREERIASLAVLISTMPPQSGADLLAQMSDDDAQALLLAIALTSERKAAKVLAMMPSERAAQLGQIYLDNERPPPGSERLGPVSPTAAPIPTPPQPQQPANKAQNKNPSGPTNGTSATPENSAEQTKDDKTP